MTYDDIKIHKKAEVQPLSRRNIFRKTTGVGSNSPSSLFRVKSENLCLVNLYPVHAARILDLSLGIMLRC